MSEVELSMFRQRSQEAIRQKARRGEYFTRVAEGYVLGESDRLEKDPDEQVQRIIGLVLEKFRELGSARQVYLWFRQEEIKLPKRAGKAALSFVSATPWLVTRILKDPVYAGAYAFGRTSQQVVLDKGRKRVLKRRHARPEDWDVLLQGRQIPGELMQILFFLLGKGGRRWIEPGQHLLQRRGVLQRLIPAALQGSRHKAVFRLDRIVLTPATGGLETGAFKLQLKLAPFLRPRFGQLVRRLSKRLYPDRRQRCQHRVRNRLLDLETAA
jgi:hypothetical protein